MEKNNTFVKFSIYFSICFIILILIMTIIFKDVSNKIYSEVVLEKDLIYELKCDVQDVTHKIIQYNKDLNIEKLKDFDLIWSSIYEKIDKLNSTKDIDKLESLETNLKDFKELQWWIKEFASMEGNEQAKYIYDKDLNKIIENIHKILLYINNFSLNKDEKLKSKNISIALEKSELYILNFIYKEDKIYMKLFYENIKNIQKLIDNLNNIPILIELKKEINAYKYYFDLITKINSSKNSYSENLIEKELIPLENQILQIINSMLEIKSEILKGDLKFKNIFGNILIISFISLIIFIISILRFISKQQYKIDKYMDIIDKNVITSTTDLNGIITDVSEAFSTISGFSKKELIGINHNIVRHPDMPKSIFKELWSKIKSGKSWNGELKNLKKNKTHYWVKVHISPVFNKNQNIIGYTSIRQDITDKKIIEEISITDELTKLYNRRCFNNLIVKEIQRAKRNDTYFSFLILDIDHFKQYNDTYGHQAGDEVLKSIGKTLKESLQRSSDFAFRLGGEEFGVIFSGLDIEKSLEFANIIRIKIEELQIEHKKNTASKFLTASTGILVQKGENILDDDKIYKLADDALYEAKESGRNRVILSKSST